MNWDYKDWFISEYWHKEDKTFRLETTDQSHRSRNENGAHRGTRKSTLAFIGSGSFWFGTAAFDVWLSLVFSVQFGTCVIVSIHYPCHIAKSKVIIQYYLNNSNTQLHLNSLLEYQTKMGSSWHFMVLHINGMPPRWMPSFMYVLKYKIWDSLWQRLVDA